MKISFVLVGIFLQILEAHRPNIYAANYDQEPEAFEKNALPIGGRGTPLPKSNPAGHNAAGTFQRGTPFSGNRGAAAGGAKQPAPRGQFQPNFANQVATKTAAPVADWPWSGKAPQQEAAPQVLVATIMTTITKFAVLTSTVTNNIVELITQTETETEMITRHSTRTVQVPTTLTQRFTLTKSFTETETSTTFSLVPFTITEIETQTRTIENVILTTFTMPASTLHKTIFSTLTESAKTVTMTEYLQPLIETIAVETVTQTETFTSSAVRTVTVEVEKTPQAKIEEPVDQLEYNYEDDLNSQEYQEFFDQYYGSQEDILEEELVSSVPIQEETVKSEPLETESVEQENSLVEVSESHADLNSYPVSQEEQHLEFEFVSHLPSGADVIEVEAPKPVAEERVLAAIQHSPFMATNKLTANQFKRVY